MNRTLHLGGGSPLPSAGQALQQDMSFSRPHLSITSAPAAACVVPVSDSLPSSTGFQGRGRDWATESFVTPFSIEPMLNMVTLRGYERGKSFCSRVPGERSTSGDGAECGCLSTRCLLLLAAESRSCKRPTAWADPAWRLWLLPRCNHSQGILFLYMYT